MLTILPSLLSSLLCLAAAADIFSEDVILHFDPGGGAGPAAAASLGLAFAKAKPPLTVAKIKPGTWAAMQRPRLAKGMRLVGIDKLDTVCGVVPRAIFQMMLSADSQNA